MKTMNTTDVVNKLIGSISPAGRSEIDAERLENLKAMCQLIEELVNQVDDVIAYNHHAYEASIKTMVDYSRDFLSNTLKIKKEEDQ